MKEGASIANSQLRRRHRSRHALVDRNGTSSVLAGEEAEVQVVAWETRRSRRLRGSSSLMAEGGESAFCAGRCRRDSGCPLRRVERAYLEILALLSGVV